MFFGTCTECGDSQYGRPAEDHEFYCDTCWEFDMLEHARQFSVATVYDIHTRHMIAFGTSIGKCAERNALEWVPRASFARPLLVMVCRIHKSGSRTVVGRSKPCLQCIAAMQQYRISAVAYSVPRHADFVCERVAHVSNSYTTESNGIPCIETKTTAVVGQTFAVDGVGLVFEECAHSAQYAQKTGQVERLGRARKFLETLPTWPNTSSLDGAFQLLDHKPALFTIPD